MADRATNGDCAAIASATSVAHLKELIGAAKLKLDETAMGFLNRASDWRG